MDQKITEILSFTSLNLWPGPSLLDLRPRLALTLSPWMSKRRRDAREWLYEHEHEYEVMMIEEV